MRVGLWYGSLFSLASVLVACGGGDSDTDVVDDSDIETGDSDTETDTDTAVEGTRVKGTVKGPDGKAMRTAVNMCLETCYTVTSDENTGAFEFIAPLPDGDYWFYVVPIGEYPTVASSSVPYTLDGTAEEVSFEVGLPALGAWTDLPATASYLTLADGLSVSVGKNNLKIEDGRTKTAGAAVAVADLPDVPVPAGSIVKAYYLQPFAAKAADGQKVPFRITNTWGGVDGETYEVYTGKYAWEKVGSYTLTGGVLSGDDLGMLTSVLIVKP